MTRPFLISLLAGMLLAGPSAALAQPRQGVSDLAVMHASVAGIRMRDGALVALDIDAELVNMGHGVWGREATLTFALARGTPDRGFEALTEPCGADCSRAVARTVSVPRGIASGARSAVRGRIIRRPASATLSLPSIPLGLRFGEWYTIEIALQSRADGNATNDRLLLMFVLDEQGKVVESRTERPTGPARSHAGE
jgi:hypothetical protein